MIDNGMTKEMPFKYMMLPVTSVNFTKEAGIVACISTKGYDEKIEKHGWKPVADPNEILARFVASLHPEPSIKCIASSKNIDEYTFRAMEGSYFNITFPAARGENETVLHSPSNGVPCMFRNKTMTGQKLGTLYGDVLCKNSW